ncbi:hypothetical protein [Flindersiella endophytica]
MFMLTGSFCANEDEDSGSIASALSGTSARSNDFRRRMGYIVVTPEVRRHLQTGFGLVSFVSRRVLATSHVVEQTNAGGALDPALDLPWRPVYLKIRKR